MTKEPAGGVNWAAVSAPQNGASAWQVCRSGVSRSGWLLIALPSSRQKTEGAAGCPDGQEQPSGSEPAVAYYACSRAEQLPLTPVCHAPVTTCTPFKCKHRPA